MVGLRCSVVGVGEAGRGGSRQRQSAGWKKSGVRCSVVGGRGARSGERRQSAAAVGKREEERWSVFGRLMLDAGCSMLDGRRWSLFPRTSSLVPPAGRPPRVSWAASSSAFISVHLRFHPSGSGLRVLGCRFRVSGASLRSWLLGSLPSVSSAWGSSSARICAICGPLLLVRCCRTQWCLAGCNMSNSARPMLNTALWPGRGEVRGVSGSGALPALEARLTAGGRVGILLATSGGFH